MSTQIIGTTRRWSGSRDKEGYREYKVVFLVMGDEDDGPANALLTTGLPVVGSAWSFADDADPFAYCKQETTVTPVKDKDKNLYFELEFTFSTRPNKICYEDNIENPLLKAQVVGGGQAAVKTEGVQDRFGNPILNSSFERIQSTQNEWDAVYPTIEIEQNVASLSLALCSSMENTVNAYTLWGFPPRCVRLSEFTWIKKYYGLCFPYYTRKFKFDINPNSFDRNLLDEGTKVLRGQWDFTTQEWVLTPTPVDGEPPNRLDPTHYIRFKDANNENTRTLLDEGRPYKPPSLVSTCSVCPLPAGAFRKWRTTGLDREHIVTYDSGCTWTNTDDPQNPALNYVALNDTWTFELDEVTGTGSGASPGGVWATADLNWNCKGANVMERIAGSHPAPFITLSEKGPTMLHIEKYFESDFLLLGIPTTF